MNYQFYVEHEDLGSANVVAVFLGEDRQPIFVREGEDSCRVVAATQYYPNAPVDQTVAPLSYLTGERCRPVSEENARQIHPQLFAVLDELPPAARSSLACKQEQERRLCDGVKSEITR